MIMSLGKNVRKLRRLKNLTQTQLAEKIGVSLQMIGRIERDVWHGPIDRVMDLAQFFGVLPHELDENLIKYYKPEDLEWTPKVSQEQKESIKDLSGFKVRNVFAAVPGMEHTIPDDEPLKNSRIEIIKRIKDIPEIIEPEDGFVVSKISILKCRAIERIMDLHDDDILIDILDFINYKMESGKKISH